MARALQIPNKIRQAVYSRENLFCCRCGKYVGSGALHSVHHRYPRKMGGSTDPRINDVRNLVLLCGNGTTGCHGWIESNRTQACKDGWILLSLNDVDRPVRNVYGQRIQLLEHGSKVLVVPRGTLPQPPTNQEGTLP